MMKLLILPGLWSKGTKCSNDTKKVLIEFAHFNPEDIIGRALKYNLKSDSA